MSSSSRFSIFLPVHNGGTYLRPCVESVLAQSCGDFELVILENASTDGTAEWLATLRDSRVRLHHSERLLSIEENWARICTIPKAEFLTTIGHDDLLDPKFLEIISRLIRAHPEAGLYQTHFRLIDADGGFLRHCRPMPARETAAEFLAARLCELRDSFGTGHVLRSATYDALGGIPPYPKLLFADDALFLQAIGASYRATALEESFSYRWYPASASRGCAMEELFTGLEQYAAHLATLRDSDPALAEVLGRYFPAYAVQVGNHWRYEALLAAYHARTPLPSRVTQRIEQLVKLFEGGPLPAPMADKIGNRLLERSGRSHLDRALYTAWRIARNAGFGLLRRTTAGRPPPRP